MSAKSIYNDTLMSSFSDLIPVKLANTRELNYFCNMQQLRYEKGEKRHKDGKATKEKEEAYLRDTRLRPNYTRRNA